MLISGIESSGFDLAFAYKLKVCFGLFPSCYSIQKLNPHPPHRVRKVAAPQTENWHNPNNKCESRNASNVRRHITGEQWMEAVKRVDNVTKIKALHENFSNKRLYIWKFRRADIANLVPMSHSLWRIVHSHLRKHGRQWEKRPAIRHEKPARQRRHQHDPRYMHVNKTFLHETYMFDQVVNNLVVKSYRCELSNPKEKIYENNDI